MPVHQSHPFHGHLLPRRPSLLRVLGETIITIADRHEAARAERRLSRADSLPGHLRRDIGLEVLDIWPSHWRR